MTAQTTIKMNPDDHAALKALLQYMAGKITTETLEAILVAQGRLLKGVSAGRIQSVIADVLLSAIS